MAVRKRGSTWQIDFFDPSGKRVRLNFKTKKEAEAEHAKRIVLKAEKRWVDVKKDYTTTLDELLTKYVENYQDQPSFKSSKVFFMDNFRQYFKEEKRISEIKYLDLETYRNQLKRTPNKERQTENNSNHQQRDGLSSPCISKRS
jgi:hypothetical protein